MTDGLSADYDAAICTVCGSVSLRRATWGKRCDLLQHDLSRCPGMLKPTVTASAERPDGEDQ